MTVKQLINQLKKMPQNLEVYWADHDHSTYETNSVAGKCFLVDKDEMTDFNNDGDDDTFKNTPQKYVCIRP